MFLCPSVHRFEEYQALPTTESFIYKLNDSTGKFFLCQTIDTSGAEDLEYCTSADKHYLAVANHQNGLVFQLNSVVYQWNGHHFIPLQSVTTNGSTSFDFFTTLQELFLTYGNSVIYK